MAAFTGNTKHVPHLVTVPVRPHCWRLSTHLSWHVHRGTAMPSVAAKISTIRTSAAVDAMAKTSPDMWHAICLASLAGFVLGLTSDLGLTAYKFRPVEHAICPQPNIISRSAHVITVVCCGVRSACEDEEVPPTRSECGTFVSIALGRSATCQEVVTKTRVELSIDTSPC